MSTTSYLHQPFTGQLGDIIAELCEKDSYTTLFISVAFAKVSGVLRLKKSLELFAKKGATINAYIGIDLGGTSYEALIALNEICTNLYVAHVGSAQTFHPKIYAFKSNDSLLAIVGSNNLTGGGLWTNMESSSITALNSSTEEDIKAINQINEYFTMLSDGTEAVAKKVESREFIDGLLAACLIEREMTIRIKKARDLKAKKDSQTGLSSISNFCFMNSISAPIPNIEALHKKSHREQKKPEVIEAFLETQPDDTENVTLIDKHKGYQTFWFETRKLTGGSRNILDLSMRAKVEKGDPSGTEYDLGEDNFMGGGVLFFGINPDSDSSIDVAINYEGTDYLGNTVKFPKGDKANGTWRLQIKGVSSAEEKITDAFEQGYLVDKILVFERIQQDYFTMTVFSSSELEEFREASEIVARNGASQHAKLFGLL